MEKRKYEREIEEILRKAEEDGWASKSGNASKANAPDNIRRPSRPANRPTGFRITPGLVVGLSLGALVLVFLIRPFAPEISVLLTPLVVVFCLGALFYYYVSTSAGGKMEKRWRGQTIDMSKSNDPLANIRRTLERWFGRR